MTSSNASNMPAAIEECLQIIDLYAEENREMGGDAILAYIGHQDPEKLITGSIIHSSAYRTAKNIGEAIRERFGLPAKDI